MVQHYCHGITISIHPKPATSGNLRKGRSRNRHKSNKCLNGDVCSRASLWGHDVPAEGVLVKDVSAKDVPTEDVLDGDSKDMKSLCGCHFLNGDVLSKVSSKETSSARTSCSYRDVPNGYDLGGDIYVCFYFCPFVETCSSHYVHIMYKIREDHITI